MLELSFIVFYRAEQKNTPKNITINYSACHITSNGKLRMVFYLVLDGNELRKAASVP